jgi:hypothetical protein
MGGFAPYSNLHVSFVKWQSEIIFKGGDFAQIPYDIANDEYARGPAVYLTAEKRTKMDPI